MLWDGTVRIQLGVDWSTIFFIRTEYNCNRADYEYEHSTAFHFQNCIESKKEVRKPL